MSKTLNPGSLEAAREGCNCSPTINKGGHEEPVGGWRMRATCPMHGGVAVSALETRGNQDDGPLRVDDNVLVKASLPAALVEVLGQAQGSVSTPEELAGHVIEMVGPIPEGGFVIVSGLKLDQDTAYAMWAELSRITPHDKFLVLETRGASLVVEGPTDLKEALGDTIRALVKEEVNAQLEARSSVHTSGAPGGVPVVRPKE